MRQDSELPWGSWRDWKDFWGGTAENLIFPLTSIGMRHLPSSCKPVRLMENSCTKSVRRCKIKTGGMSLYGWEEIVSNDLRSRWLGSTWCWPRKGASCLPSPLLSSNFVPGLCDCDSPWVGNFPVLCVQQGNTGLASWTLLLVGISLSSSLYQLLW